MSTTASSTLVQGLWNYCDILPYDGMSYEGHVGKLSYRLFLTMDGENSTMIGKPAQE